MREGRKGRVRRVGFCANRVFVGKGKREEEKEVRRFEL